jgi:hypothetical protein
VNVAKLAIRMVLVCLSVGERRRTRVVLLEVQPELPMAAQSSDGLRQVLFDFTTHKWQELMTGVQVGYPNWSHDGKYIYYDTQPGNEAGFYRVRIGDRKIERLTIFKNTRRVFWILGVTT